MVSMAWLAGVLTDWLWLVGWLAGCRALGVHAASAWSKSVILGWVLKQMTVLTVAHLS